MSDTDYDLIIAGASYAGLAMARHLNDAGGRVLLVDEHALGAVRHSACAVPTATLQQIGAMAGAVQESHWGVIHTAVGATRYRSPAPWTVFDHRRVCEALRAQAPDVPLVRARVSGFDGHTLTTDKGTFTARHFADATGWRAILANALQPGVTARGQLTVGMEVTVPHHTEALEFFVNREIVRWGYGWVFPYGDESRVGLGAFDNQKGMPDLLRAFLRRLGMPDDLRTLERAGGMLPWQQRASTLANVWLLGDAAGHCLPLTGEGIRFAMQDGDAAGQVYAAMRRGEIAYPAASMAYTAAVARHRARVRTFISFQSLVRHVPNRAFGAMAWVMARRSVRERYLARYMAWEHEGMPIAAPAASVPPVVPIAPRVPAEMPSVAGGE